MNNEIVSLGVCYISHIYQYGFITCYRVYIVYKSALYLVKEWC